MNPRTILSLLLLSGLLSCRRSDPPQPSDHAPSSATGAAVAPVADATGAGGSDSSSGPSRSGGRIPESVYGYHEAFERLSKTLGPADLPALWEKEVVASRELQSVLEDLPDSLFRRAETLMVWHKLCREEIVFVSPMPDSFRTLAQKRGTPADTAFFGYMTAAGGWNWKRSITDYSACDELGSPGLFQSLRRIEEIRPGLPSVYLRNLAGPTEDLRSSIRFGICACEGRIETLKDFERNLATFPVNLPVRALLDSLRDTLSNPRKKDRYNCSPT